MTFIRSVSKEAAKGRRPVCPLNITISQKKLSVYIEQSLEILRATQLIT